LPLPLNPPKPKKSEERAPLFFHCIEFFVLRSV